MGQQFKKARELSEIIKSTRMICFGSLSWPKYMLQLMQQT